MKVSRLVLALGLLLLLARLASGQGSDPLMGLTPYQSFAGSQFDHINVFSGLLNFRIPLFNYPQRGGKLAVSGAMQYNGKYWVTTAVCDPGDPTSCNIIYGHIRGGGPTLVDNRYLIGVSNAPLASGFKLVDTQRVSPATTSYTLSCGTYGVGGNPTCRKSYRDYELVTPDGALHPYHALFGTTDNSAGSTGSTMMTLDGTGYRSDSSGTRDRNGTLVGSHDIDGNVLGALTDGNGNQTGIIDTFGRSIQTVPSSTTDYSGCKGPLSVSSATTLSLPGANGSTLQYKFCYATASVYIPASLCNSDGDLSTTQTVLQSILLPNGQSWSFEYQARGATDPSSYNFGEVSKINLPTGGSISYQYAMGPDSTYPACSARVVARTVFDGRSSNTWAYSFQMNGSVGRRRTPLVMSRKQPLMALDSH